MVRILEDANAALKKSVHYRVLVHFIPDLPTPVFTTLWRTHTLKHNMPPELQQAFSFFFTHDPMGSKIYVGGLLRSNLASPLSWVPVEDPEDGYWKVSGRTPNADPHKGWRTNVSHNLSHKY